MPKGIGQHVETRLPLRLQLGRQGRANGGLVSGFDWRGACHLGNHEAQSKVIAGRVVCHSQGARGEVVRQKIGVVPAAKRTMLLHASRERNHVRTCDKIWHLKKEERSCLKEKWSTPISLHCSPSDGCATRIQPAYLESSSTLQNQTRPAINIAETCNTQPHTHTQHSPHQQRNCSLD